MSRSYNSSWETIGDASDPDVIYYNASIINNTTDDTLRGIASQDPQIRFNETRDTSIVKDASRYQFSIIRFVVNGGNKDLPLFIPAIQSSTGQTDPNLTEYGVGIIWNGQIGTTNQVITPPLTYLNYVPETKNPYLAPLPRPPCNASYVGVWSATTVYNTGDIVGNLNGTAFWVASPKIVPPQTVAPTTVPAGTPTGNTDFWKTTGTELGKAQDLSSKYYWVYTYSHMVDMMNQTFIDANKAVWSAYNAITTPGKAVYATFLDWLTDYPSPKMIYNNTTGLFSIYYPPCYASPAEQLEIETAPLPALSQTFLFFNVNMEGLFSNFNNIYYNSGGIFPVWPYTPEFSASNVPGYANNMIVNIIGLQDNVVTDSADVKWLKMTQDFASTSTLWSPIESIVFTSTLLPIQNEQTAPANTYGRGNIGNSATTSPSAFSPIITDVALDLATDPSGYRKMIYYAPAAEFRMADFQNSKQDIRNIDVQVYWKNRLDNTLYPMTMFNLSSVSIKLMFRKKSYPPKGDRHL